jgi:hypothetical protein
MAKPPVRWVDGTDLVHWADRRDAQGGIPELLTRLIRASKGTAAKLHFRADEGIQLPGWDGTCEIDNATLAYIRGGGSGWEISAQRADISGKAVADYEKRTADPLELFS